MGQMGNPMGGPMGQTGNPMSMAPPSAGMGYPSAPGMPSMANPANIPAQAPSRPAGGEKGTANFMDSLVDDLSLSLKPKDPNAGKPQPMSGLGPSMKDLQKSSGPQGFNPF